MVSAITAKHSKDSKILRRTILNLRQDDWAMIFILLLPSRISFEHYIIEYLYLRHANHSTCWETANEMEKWSAYLLAKLHKVVSVQEIVKLMNEHPFAPFCLLFYSSLSIDYPSISCAYCAFAIGFGALLHNSVTRCLHVPLSSSSISYLLLFYCIFSLVLWLLANNFMHCIMLHSFYDACKKFEGILWHTKFLHAS